MIFNSWKEAEEKFYETNDCISDDSDKEQARIEQERRLAYVAITRPIKNLTIICPSVVGGKPGGVSQFVDEAGLVVGENVPKPNAGAVSKEASVAHWHLPRGVKSAPNYERQV